VKSSRGRYEGHYDQPLPSAAEEAVEQAYLDLASVETRKQESERYAAERRAFGPAIGDESLAGAAVVRERTWLEVRRLILAAAGGRVCY